MKYLSLFLLFAAAPIFAAHPTAPLVLVDPCLDALSKANPWVLADPTLEDGAYNDAVVEFVSKNASLYDVPTFTKALAMLRPHAGHQAAIERMVLRYLQTPRILGQISFGDFVVLLNNVSVSARDNLLPRLATSEGRRMETAQALALAAITSTEDARNRVLIYYYEQNVSNNGVSRRSRLTCDEILLLLSGWNTEDTYRNGSGIAGELLAGNLCGPLDAEQAQLAQLQLERLLALPEFRTP